MSSPPPKSVGELTLVVDGQAHAVPAGTSATCEANVPHAYRNEGRDVVEVIMAVSVPPVR
ncbi:cupin domain-containing protein [Streptomyces sp. NPDC096176]|uniref:cupin domain-containing protein n=1 Tax=Streptomyces sp. NPDC096176 TaxID=3366079 RepID=UPI0037FC5F3F